MADEILRWMDVPGAPPGANEAKEESERARGGDADDLPPPPAAA